MSIHNNIIDSGFGRDMVFGNAAVIAMPVVNSLSGQADAGTDKDLSALLKDLTRHTDEQYDIQHKVSESPWHHNTYIDRGKANTKMNLTAGNDTIYSPSDKAVVFGDSASVFGSVLIESIDSYAPAKTLTFKVSNLELNRQLKHSYQQYDTKLSTIDNDSIVVGGAAMVYGQWGSDNLTATSAGAVVFGGSGKDVIDTIPGSTSSGAGSNAPSKKHASAIGDQLFTSTDPFRKFLIDLSESQPQDRSELVFEPSLGMRLDLDSLALASEGDIAGEAISLAAIEKKTDAYQQLVEADDMADYVELFATINTDKPLRGFRANGYIIFDYISETNFKYAGINDSRNRIEIGHRTEKGWVIDAKKAMRIKTGTDYTISLGLNGSAASLVVNNDKAASYTYASSVNTGAMGLGTYSAAATFDQVRMLGLTR